MNKFEAHILLKNLLNRVVANPEGRMQLSGTLTEDELTALKFSINLLSDRDQVAAPTTLLPLPADRSTGDNLGEKDQTLDGDKSEEEVFVDLDLDSLSSVNPNSNTRICLDFGTAMSKAVLVDDDNSEILVLPIGEYGGQELIGESTMLVSSVYIDDEGLIWFGQQAIEQSSIADDEFERQRLDSVKASLSDGVLRDAVSKKHNPTNFTVTYGDMVLANLTFLSWAVNHSLEKLNRPRYTCRRFALPCLTGEIEKETTHELRRMLGEAQILADSFFQTLTDGIPLGDFLSKVNAIRAEQRNYQIIGEDLTEPRGVAGSRLSFRTTQEAASYMVIDVGAGTTDFGLYRLSYDNRTGKSSSSEIPGSTRSHTEAGDHIDLLLRESIIKKSGIAVDDPNLDNVRYDLQRRIRSYKETLFEEGSVSIQLWTNDLVTIELDELLEVQGVKQFGSDLKKTVENMFEEIDPDWLLSLRGKPVGVILTGGGAELPMIKDIANGNVYTPRVTIQLTEAMQVPKWLSDNYPEVADDYARVAVSLGGARKRLISKSPDLSVALGDLRGKRKLDGFYTKGR